MFRVLLKKHRVEKSTKHEPKWKEFEARTRTTNSSPQILSSATTTTKTITSSFTDFVEKQHKNLKAAKWLLSNSTCVEDKVLEFARKCNHEHACHALIIDVNDPSWVNGKYFTQQELEEIGSYNLEPMPTLTAKVMHHLQSFQAYDPTENPTGKTVQQLMAYKVDNSALDHKDDYDLMWINDSVARATKMYRWGYFPITHHTEGDLLRRVWAFIEDCFDNAGIQVRGGEKTSSASANRRNDARIVAGAESMSRKAIGRRGDLIFVYSKVELGCGELGRYNEGAKGSKELRESFLKTPKMMKDELAELISKRPDKRSQFRVVGFISMGLTLQMLVMDSPTGNVCRIRRTQRYEYPETVDLFQASVLPMYEMVLKAKAIMLGNIRILESPPARQAQTVDFAPVTSTSFRLPPCPPSPQPPKIPSPSTSSASTAPSNSSSSSSSSSVPQKRPLPSLPSSSSSSSSSSVPRKRPAPSLPSSSSSSS
ncbi:hypothetical protein BJV82DRAFT_236025 [Fennellomyces sp. T-0311]|nr:hypothetical protein BJV82DRAFT_236025 [Fennellomyces sp. T-0311]